MLLPKIVGRFKMNSAKQINAIRGTPGIHVWQRGYYEHVIRDGRELDRIREYILKNPMNWTNDQNFPENVRMARIHEGSTDSSPLE
jgi:REP element-mobilizing transposase RayT